MGEWKEKKLGDLLRIKHGYAFAGEHIVTDDNGKVLVTPGNFAIGGGWKASYKKFYSGEFPDDYILSEGDVVVTMTDLSKEVDTLGFSAKVPKDRRRTFLHNQRIGLVTDIADEAVQDFLYWVMRTAEYRASIVGTASGSTVSHTSPSRIYEYAFDCPEPDEQRAIASVLSSLDAKIDLLHRQNKTLEGMAEALFRQWFVEEAEVGWENGNVSDLCTVVDFVANGSFASLKANVRLYDEPEYALFVRTTDYTGGFTGNLKYTDKASFDFLKKSRLHGDEVIISNVGNTGTVFRPPVWLGMPMTLGSNAVALLSKDKTEFLYHYFRSEPGQGALESIVTGSAQPKFNKSNLRDLEIVFPPIEVINRFEEAARAIRKSTMHNQVQIRTLTALRDTLLPKLMSGEVRVEKY